MMHRNSSGKLVEINRMHFKNDQLCFNKLYSLKRAQLFYTSAFKIIHTPKVELNYCAALLNDSKQQITRTPKIN